MDNISQEEYELNNAFNDVFDEDKPSVKPKIDKQTMIDYEKFTDDMVEATALSLVGVSIDSESEDEFDEDEFGDDEFDDEIFNDNHAAEAKKRIDDEEKLQEDAMLVTIDNIIATSKPRPKGEIRAFSVPISNAEKESELAYVRDMEKAIELSLMDITNTKLSTKAKTFVPSASSSYAPSASPHIPLFAHIAPYVEGAVGKKELEKVAFTDKIYLSVVQKNDITALTDLLLDPTKCPVSIALFYLVIENGSSETLKFMLDNGFPIPKSFVGSFVNLNINCSYDSISMIKVLLECGAVFHENLFLALACNKDFDTFDWLLTTNCPKPKSLISAIADGKKAVNSWCKRFNQ